MHILGVSSTKDQTVTICRHVFNLYVHAADFYTVKTKLTNDFYI